MEIEKILRQLCEWKQVKILEAEVCPDHIHMLVEIPPKYSVSRIMGYLKGKSSLMVFEKYANLNTSMATANSGVGATTWTQQERLVRR